MKVKKKAIMTTVGKSDLNKIGGIYSHYIFMKKYDQKSTNVVFKELEN